MNGDHEAQLSIVAGIEQEIANLRLHIHQYANQAGRETRQTWQRDAKTAAMRAHREGALKARDAIITALLSLYR